MINQLPQLSMQLQTSLLAIEQFLQEANPVYEQSLQNLSQALSEVLKDIHRVQSNQVEQTRETIASMRREIENIRDEIEESGDMVESSPGTQQQNNPQAFYNLNTYHEYGKINDLLSQINGDLMSISQQLELQKIEQSKKTTTGPVPNFDNDPAPSTLM